MENRKWRIKVGSVAREDGNMRNSPGCVGHVMVSGIAPKSPGEAVYFKCNDGSAGFARLH